MTARFYQTSNGAPWVPAGTVADKDGVRRSAANILDIWTDAQIQEVFPVLAPTWGSPPAGQMIDTETVTPDGSGGLTFTRTFKAQPDPTPAQLFADLTAQVKAEAKDKLYAALSGVTSNQYTREQLQTRIGGLSPANKTSLAALFPPLAGTDLP